MLGFFKRLMIFVSIGSIPLILLMFGYFYFDPFKVLYDYDDYSYPYVIPNRDYVSTEVLLKNKKKYGYNSFIFGSSRALAYSPDSWKRHLNEDASPFMFDASGETIYGICTKLKFLDSVNIPIDNALIIFCRDGIFDSYKNPKEHLNIKHPLTSGESKMFFQLAFIKAYLNLKFLMSFYDYTAFRNFRPYMTGYIEYRKIKYDTETNGLSILDQENEISQNAQEYYLKRKDLFYKRNGATVDTIQRIEPEYLSLLIETKRLLEKNETNYKIVLGPIYDQMKFSKEDVQILREIFQDRVFDFTGENQFTRDDRNWYETYHYRGFIGDSIMAKIY